MSDDTDSDLGIGLDDDGAPGDPIAALLANPALAALIDAAVAQRVAQMAIPDQPQGGSAFADLAASLKHMVEMTQMQQPGYIKPVPVEELDRRAAGKVEMLALLQRYEADGTPPQYVVGEEGFFECTNAQEFMDGQHIRTYLPPCVDFTPVNDQAIKVHEQMMIWIGNENPDIGERLRDAQIQSKLPPMVSNRSDFAMPRGSVEQVRTANGQDIEPRQPRAPRRSMGTVVPEPIGRSVVGGASGAPVGPNFASV